MITFEDSIEVAQEQAKVFGFITDLDNLPKIQTEVVQSRVVTPGPVAVGTRFEELVKLGPWRVATRCVVTEYDPRGTMAFRGESQPVNYESRFTVDTHRQGSRVTVRGTARLNGLWRLLEPLVAADVRKGVRHELRAIQQHTERDGRG